KHDIVRAAARLLGLDGAVFERVFALREGGGHAPSERETSELFASYLAQIERVIEAVDRLEVLSERQS
ncbi:MAG TPA: hypothetical protein VFZ44_18240, partial [Pyrinomonadaceae bacterium]